MISKSSSFVRYMWTSLVLALIGSQSIAQIHFIKHEISGDLSVNSEVIGIDFDNDGDTDIIGASIVWGRARSYDTLGTISLWENNGLQEFTNRLITDECGDCRSVSVIDIDGDGDLDIVSSSEMANRIMWWQNDFQNFTGHIISDTFQYPYCATAADFNNDGFIDIFTSGQDIPSGQNIFHVRWWENDGNQVFVEHSLSEEVGLYTFLQAADMDNDGSIELIGNNGRWSFGWWEIDHEFNSISEPRAVHFIPYDMDYDGDMDIICTGGNWTIRLLENDGEQNFTDHRITTGPERSWQAYPADVDNDGDMDIIAWCQVLDIIWLENEGDLDFVRHTISGNPYGEEAFYPSDVDNDGDIDIIGADYESGIIWWENIPYTEEQGSFNLTVPEDGSFIAPPMIDELNFYWVESILDSNENTFYDFYLDLTIRETDFGVECERIVIDTLMIFQELQDTTLLINLLDSLPYFDSDNYLMLATWWVVAELDNDTLLCNYPFAFYSELWLSVDDNPFTNQSDEVSIISTYPNPFNSLLKVNIVVPSSGEIDLRVFNLLGKQVRVLTNDIYYQGSYRFNIDTNGLSSGIYFIRATVPGKMNEVRKVLLVR